MNGTVKKSIRLKLFFVMVSVLLFNSLFVLLFGNFFMALYYNVTTSMELEHYGKLIYNAYKNDPASLDGVLGELENKNTVVILYAADNAGKNILYLSRPGGRRTTVFTGPSPDILTRFLNELENRSQKAGEVVISGAQDKRRMAISLHVKLDEGVYLIAETPKGYLQDISQRAVVFTAIISGITFLAGGLIIFLLSGAVTAPIRRIQDTADEIANLNFAKRCDERSDDELGLLAHSINNMSDKLQENINGLKVANQSLKEQLLQKEKNEKNRREFIANVSHDFKTPLTLILSYCEALKEQIEEGGPLSREYCDIISEEGERMSSLVQQLLRLSQLESSTMALERSIFAINEIIGASVHKAKIMAAQKGINLTVNYEDSFIVDADFARIGQVFTNLLDNALKYCSREGAISVAVARRGEKCRVTVANTGEPIREEDLENLFHSFYKADKSRSIEGTSYGLGLAIVQAIMQLHQEDYGVENTPDGVLFYFELPYVQLDEEEK